MTEITVKIENEEVLLAYSQLLQRAEDLTEPNAAIAKVMADATERAFRDQKDPSDGTPWAALSDTTASSIVNGRLRGTVPILTVTGLLGNSFRPTWGPDFAMVSTGDIRAGTHHFGAQKGEFGSGRRGRPIPWGDIPPRPLVGLGSDDNEEIIDIISTHLTSNLPD